MLQALGAEGRLEKAEEARKAFAASGAKDMEVWEPCAGEVRIHQWTTINPCLSIPKMGGHPDHPAPRPTTSWGLLFGHKQHQL